MCAGTRFTCECALIGLKVLWMPLLVRVVGRPIPPYYYAHYYKDACSECMPVIPIVTPIQYSLWVSLESLQYGGLLLQNIMAHMTLARLLVGHELRDVPTRVDHHCRRLDKAERL